MKSTFDGKYIVTFYRKFDKEQNAQLSDAERLAFEMLTSDYRSGEPVKVEHLQKCNAAIERLNAIKAIAEFTSLPGDEVPQVVHL